jgi:ABC-2 type transport system ATP-binding protein
MLAIDVKNLVKRYHDKSSGTKVAVDGIDLQVALGEIFAILGPNGAGKTTTVEILEGYRDRDSGEVLVLGADPAKLHGEGERIWRNRIGIVLQSTNDGEDLSVEEMISSFARLYSNPRDVDEVISAVGLQEKRSSHVRALSGGQRRRLDVALGIIGKPEILFLDEPTTGFDPEARRAFWALIRELRDSGTTILLTTHYLDEAEALADRVAVIAGGKIVALSTPETLGGRNTAQARIRWRENGELREHSTDHPTAFLGELAQRFTGEIPELTITRPTLEEIYLEMIGE